MPPSTSKQLTRPDRCPTETYLIWRARSNSSAAPNRQYILRKLACGFLVWNSQSVVKLLSRIRDNKQPSWVFASLAERMFERASPGLTLGQ